jgi:hypothetical protein
MVAKASKAGKSSAWSTSEPARRAVTLAEAAELLDVSLRDVKRAAEQVEPYLAAGGVQKWPVRELARVLADCGGTVPPSYLRPPDYEQARQRRRRHRDRASS